MLFRRLLRVVCPNSLAPLELPSTSAAAAFSASPDGPVLKIGDVLSLRRRFSETDVTEYARVSGDANPLHFEDDFARSVSQFDGRVVHGMLIASLFPTVIASHFPGAVYVSQTLQFKMPVYIGEQVVAEIRPTILRKNKNRYLAKFMTKCVTNGELVLDGEAMTILPTLTLKE